MTNAESIVTILIMAVTTATIRFLPFLIFRPHKPVPAFIQYLGQVLPMAAIALLVVYALKDTSLTVYPFGLPQIIAISCIYLLHRWQGNALLSIAGGTVIYMVLVQGVL